MKRYDEITKLLQDEMGYELIWRGKNEQNKEAWKFKKDGFETEMNEDNISDYYIPKATKWIFDIEGHKTSFKHLKTVWEEHRRIDKNR